MSASIPLPRDPLLNTDHPLARAFASFTEAAGSLERTYGQLQTQVIQLRHELEVTNRDLAQSLDENQRIRERLKRILEGLPCGVLVVEAEGKITTVNPEAERLLGAGLEDIDSLVPHLAEALQQSRATGHESEVAISLPNGVGAVWVAIRHARLHQDYPDSSSVFIIRDISDTKRLELDRENLRRQQALVEMSALLAHEIRNPLGSLELFAGLLAEAELRGDSRRWVEHVQAGLRMLSATVNNVLHLHNNPIPECAEMDAGELLDWAYGFLLPLARQSRAELQVTNRLRGVVVHADRHRLEQVVLNLALNAFRFMPDGGWLSIHGDDLGPQGIEIALQDTGPGINADDLPRVFQPGFSTRPGSCGLGLAVCQRIIEQHGGTISVESRPGCGATFRLRLPAMRGAA